MGTSLKGTFAVTHSLAFAIASISHWLISATSSDVAGVGVSGRDAARVRGPEGGSAWARRRIGLPHLKPEKSIKAEQKSVE